MKKQVKAILIFTGVIILCCLIMIGSSYLYLEISLNSADADRNEEHIPYAAPLPDSAGILITLPENNGYMIFLNFADGYINIADIDTIDKDINDYYGYTISYKMEADYHFLSNIIDRLGGIELYDSGETLRYTGTQIIDKIQKTSGNTELRREVIRKFFYNLSNIGLSKEDFIYIIENSETDLTVPDCYYWPPYISKIAKNTRFIN